jgi:geranylgeranyl diphosphate synthase type II
VTATGAAQRVAEVLEEYGALTRATLAGYLQPQEPRRHLYDLVADYPTRGGRMLRPSLCIATAHVFGAAPEQAARTAAGLELLHNAFLVHDDVEDDSEERRGRPTLHALHGVPIAVNVGDALTLLSLAPLIDNRAELGDRLAMRVLEETLRMARETVEGQALELGWRRENAIDLTQADYLEMILKKTCWYTSIHPSRAGALIGTRDGIDLERFVRFGFFLGAAFQIQDDLLNLVGDAERYGKELHGDLWEGKRTLMLIDLLQKATPSERAQLAELLRLPRHERSAADVRWIRKQMDAYGCLAHARQVAHGLAGAALHEYSLLYGGLPDSRDKRFIEGLITWVIERA